MQVKNEKNSDISERIRQIIDYYNLTPNSFAKKLGYNRSQVIYDILNRKAKPSYDFFLRLLNTDISVNNHWLITGIGSMLPNSDGSNDAKPAQVVPVVEQSCAQCAIKDKLIESQQATIEAQRETINLLKQELKACGNSKKPPLPDTLPAEVTAKLKKD